MNAQTTTGAEISIERTQSQTAELTVVVPTFNERDNVLEVVQRLDSCLR